MENVVLTARGLTKTFGGFTAVDHISFDVKEGEVLGILGPNGAGKTTTIYMLLNLIIPSSGELTLFGMQYRDNHEKILQQMNFASAYMDMMPRMTVYENLFIMAKLYQVPDVKAVISRHAKDTGIEDLLNWQHQKLSAGQKTRVQLCKHPRDLQKLSEKSAYSL